MNIDLRSFAPAVPQCLIRYTWPANNPQLENEIRRLIAFVLGKTLLRSTLTRRSALGHPCSGRARSKKPPLALPIPTLQEAA